MAVNVELTAEEWRRRFEKEREISQKLKVIVQQQEAELARWRAGESVPEAERSKLKIKAVVVPTVEDSSTAARAQGGGLGVNSSPGVGLATPTATPIATPTPVQTRAFEEERTRLCQQLDEKVGRNSNFNLCIYVSLLYSLILSGTTQNSAPLSSCL